MVVSAVAPVRLVLVADPMDPVGSRSVGHVPFFGTSTVADYIPAEWVDEGLQVQRNGYVVDPMGWAGEYVRPGDEILIQIMPGVSVLVSIAINVALSLATTAISRALGPKKKPPLRRDPLSAGAGTIQTGPAEGYPIPVVYGKRKVGGHEINQSTGAFGGQSFSKPGYNASQLGRSLRADYALCEGPVRSIAGSTSNIEGEAFNSYGPGQVVIDQLDIPTDSGVGLGEVNEAVAGAFKTSSRAVITRISAMMENVGSIPPGSKVYATIRGGTISGPDAIDGFEPVGVDVSTIPFSKSRVDFNLPAPFAVDVTPSSNWFWVVFTVDFPLSPSNFVRMFFQSTNSGGFSGVKVDPGSGWINSSPTGTLAFGVDAQPKRFERQGVKVNGADVTATAAIGLVNTRKGDKRQPPLPGQTDLITDQLLETSLPLNTEVVHTTSNEVDDLAISIFFPSGLFFSRNSGGVLPANLDLDVRFRPVGATQWTSFKILEPILTLSPDGADYEIVLPQNMKGSRIEVGITRVGPSVSSQDIVWRSIKEFGEGAYGFSHPHIALGQLELDMSSATGPVRNVTWVVEGKEMWVWDGSRWSFQYTRNPADHLLDWCLNTRYGGGRWIKTDDIDFASFTLFRNHCNELIPDGKGGFMPRYQCDIEINDRSDWFDVAQRIAGTGNASLTGVGTKVRVVMETDEIGGVDVSDPVQMFTDGNIIANTFELERVGLRDQPARIVAEFRDEELDWELSQAEWEREDDSAGTIEPDEEKVFLDGVTNAERARRWVKRQVERQSIRWKGKFETSINAVTVRDGCVIEIQSRVPFWKQQGGVFAEVLSGSNAVKLEEDITLEPGETYKIRYEAVDSVSGALYTEERTVLEAAGTYTAGTAIDLDPAMNPNRIPVKGATYSIGVVQPDGQSATRKARVTRFEVTDDFRVLVEFEQWVRIVDDPQDTPISIIRPPITRDTIPLKPQGLTLKPVYGQSTGTSILCTWQRPTWPYDHDFEIWVRQEGIGGTRFTGIARVNATQFLFPNIAIGSVWTVAVLPVAPTGNKPNPASPNAAQEMIRVIRVGLRPPKPANLRF